MENSVWLHSLKSAPRDFVLPNSYTLANQTHPFTERSAIMRLLPLAFNSFPLSMALFATGFVAGFLIGAFSVFVLQSLTQKRK